VSWNEWVRGAEIEPSLYAADFARLGEQIEILLAAGARIFHFDVGDGHFVPPVTIGPIVLESISPIVHKAGGRLDCHLMVDRPDHHFEAIAEAGGDSVTFHYEAGDVDLVLCMSIEPGYSGQAFMPEAIPRIERLRALLPEEKHVQVDGGVGGDNVRSLREAGVDLLVAGTSVFGAGDIAQAYRSLADAAQ
jgi:ribulose-phosphate 3-epimerase